jgi:hypothetical protein
VARRNRAVEMRECAMLELCFLNCNNFNPKAETVQHFDVVILTVFAKYSKRRFEWAGLIFD